MKKNVFVFCSLILVAVAVRAALSMEALLAKSDAIRNPQLDYVMRVRITSVKPNHEPTVATYQVYVKGREKSIVQTLTPPADRGSVLLMNGSNFWGYLPTVSKPLRISLQEKLTGEVANGDLARSNFSGDYAIEKSKEVLLEGRRTAVLDMKAKSPDLTYGRVVLWIDVASTRPIKAEFYALSGRLLKTCLYERFRENGGAVRPSRLVMRDAINKDVTSTLDYEEVTLQPLPDKYFSKDYMKKLAVE